MLFIEKTSKMFVLFLTMTAVLSLSACSSNSPEDDIVRRFNGSSFYSNFDGCRYEKIEYFTRLPFAYVVEPVIFGGRLFINDSYVKYFISEPREDKLLEINLYNQEMGAFIKYNKNHQGVEEFKSLHQLIGNSKHFISFWKVKAVDCPKREDFSLVIIERVY